MSLDIRQSAEELLNKLEGSKLNEPTMVAAVQALALLHIGDQLANLAKVIKGKFFF